MKKLLNFKYNREHQRSCDILMFIYLVASKLFYLRMDGETFNAFMTEVSILKKPVHWFAFKPLDWFLYDRNLRYERVK